MLCATALQSGQTTLPACAAKQVISSPWGAPLLGLPKPVADSHAKDAPRQIPSILRTSPLLVYVIPSPVLYISHRYPSGFDVNCAVPNSHHVDIFAEV